MFKPEETFGHRFRLIHNAIEKSIDKQVGGILEGERLTGVQFATLHYLFHHQTTDVFQKDIEAAFHISRATASNILKGMEKKGLIQRVPMEYDGRLKKLLLTQKAYEHDKQARIGVERTEQWVIKGMTEEEIHTFRSLLDRAIQNLVDMSQDE